MKYEENIAPYEGNELKLQTQSKNRYINNYDKMLAANRDARNAVDESKPTYNADWIKRMKQASRVMALNSMLTLIGQSIMAANGVKPGKAPTLNRDAMLRQINKINDDYRHYMRNYTSNKMREAMQRESIHEKLTRQQMALEGRDDDRKTRKEIASERNELSDRLAKLSSDTKKDVANLQAENRIDLQDMKDKAASSRLAQKDNYLQQKEERERTMPKKPIMFIKDGDNSRKALHEHEFIELYNQASQKNMLGSYKAATNESIRKNELRKAIQKAYKQKEESLPSPNPAFNSPINIPIY